MQPQSRVLIGLAFLTSISILLFGGTVPASATIYDANVERRIKLTKTQRPQVRRILRQSGRDLKRVLRKSGIDPNNTRPRAVKLFAASGALMAIGRRTRAQLARVLNRKQMRQYDRLTKEVERRVIKALVFGGRKRRNADRN